MRLLSLLKPTREDVPLAIAWLANLIAWLFAHWKDALGGVTTIGTAILTVWAVYDRVKKWWEGRKAKGQ